MNKTKRILVTILILMIVITGCGSKGSDVARNENQTGSSVEYSKSMEDTAVEEAEMKFQDYGGTNPLNNSTLPASRKIIQDVNISMETLEFDNTTTDVNGLVGQFNGYFESNNISGNRIIKSNQEYAYRTARYTIRIPAQQLSIFIDDLMRIGNVYNSSAGQKDVTFEYFDTEARIKSLKVQEERLLELLANGGELEQLIMLENQLSDVRYRIESLTSSIMMLDNKVNYGTVYLDIQEVYEITEKIDPPKSFGDKLSAGFVNSVQDIKNGLLNFIIFLAAALPHLVVIGLIALIILGIVKIVIGKTKKKNPVVKREDNVKDDSQK